MKKSCLLLAASLSLCACVAEEGFDPVDAVASSVKLPGSHAEVFSWDSDHPDTHLKSVNTHLCYLTAVNGDMTDSLVAVHRADYDVNSPPDYYQITNDDSTFWRLGGHPPSTQHKMKAEATCVPLNDFIGPTGTVRTVSSIRVDRVSTSRPGCSGTKYLDLGHKGVAILNDIGDTFAGGGENAEILHPDGDHGWRLKVSTEQCGYTEAAAHIFEVGVPGHTSISNFGLTQDVRATSKQTTVFMLEPIATHVCYFTRLSGNFQGAKESIRIYADGANWWVTATAGQGGSVYGRVECIPYDQVPVPVL